MTLGEFLRTEREKRGITIDQVASETKVGVRILHALESDQYVTRQRVLAAWQEVKSAG